MFDILKFAKKIQQIDDRLGKFSDYEGDDEGPTYRLFKTSTPEEWQDQCQAAIDYHKAAVRLWNAALRASRKANKP